MRAIKIHSEMTTVDEVIMDDENLLDVIAEELGPDHVEIQADPGLVLLVSAEHESMELPSFRLGSLPAICGIALVIGKGPGGYTDADVSVEKVADHIVWIDGEVIW